MIKIFTGDNRIRANQAVSQILGENYEIMNKYCPNAMKTFRKMMEEET